MAYLSHRSTEGRPFDFLYDPSYIVPSAKDVESASSVALLSSTPVQVLSRYNTMFEDSPKEARVVLRRLSNKLPTVGPGGGSMSGSDWSYRRLEGGANTASCKLPNRAIAGTIKCKNPRTPIYAQPCNNVNVINVQLNESSTNCSQFARAHCEFFGDQKRKKRRIKTRGTQTLYRESSAQTLPYLPGVSNDETELDKMELFKLPTILPGDGPPGLYEVEVLERARKRWAFAKALKDNFRKQMEEAKENIPLAQQRTVLEAFEWEHWMEREEYIQECQMMRLELVLRMFEEREQKIQRASHERIEASCSQIAARREANLRKNEIEFGRQMRRLEMKRRNAPRNWRKENITSQLGDPSSEFYAPQMRYGVNPSRRHFEAERKAFDARMDELEKRASNMKRLVCPFAKLKEWSRPKKRFTEVEQNFCSDANLKKLYESLKGLREQSMRQKVMPRCLKEKVPTEESVSHVDSGVIQEEAITEIPSPQVASEVEEDDEALYEQKRAAEEEAWRKRMAKQRERAEHLLQENRREELEAMLAEYEGSTIGWMMKFLSDEMVRLQEQRKLHFLSMLAQKERWRREAAEAGLRQKENDMREIYQQLYQQTSEANEEVCNEYLTDLLAFDTKDYADNKAITSITELAQIIDRDIQRWLDSFKSVQTPLNYKMLRYLLKDIIFPNLGVLRQRYESELVVDGIIADVLLPNVEKLLEPYDISFAIASDLIDRGIDNDLLLFSDDSCSSSECTEQELEARAILRKLIRRSVPGRRWLLPAERAADEYVNDIFDVVFKKIQAKEALENERELNEAGVQDRKHCHQLTQQASHLNLLETIHTSSCGYADSNSEEPAQLLKSMHYSNIHQHQTRNITKELRTEESLGYRVSERTSVEMQLVNIEEYDGQPRNVYTSAPLKYVASQMDMLSQDGFLPEDSEVDQCTSSDYSIDIGIKFDKSAGPAKSVKAFVRDVVIDIVKTVDTGEKSEQEEQSVFGEEVDWQTIEGAEEELEDDPQTVLSNILGRIFKSITGSADRFSPSLSQIDEMPEEEGAEEEDDFKLVVNESEIELMEIIRCKCKTELEREELIRKLLKEGKVKIVRRQKPVDEEEEEDDISIETFEYSEKDDQTAARPDVGVEDDLAPIDDVPPNTEATEEDQPPTLDAVQSGEGGGVPQTDEGVEGAQSGEVVEGAQSGEVVEGAQIGEAIQEAQSGQIVAGAQSGETLQDDQHEKTMDEDVKVEEAEQPMEQQDVPMEQVSEQVPEQVPERVPGVEAVDAEPLAAEETATVEPESPAEELAPEAPENVMELGEQQEIPPAEEAPDNNQIESEAVQLEMPADEPQE